MSARALALIAERRGDVPRSREGGGGWFTFTLNRAGCVAVKACDGMSSPLETLFRSHGDAQAFACAFLPEIAEYLGAPLPPGCTLAAAGSPCGDRAAGPACLDCPRFAAAVMPPAPGLPGRVACLPPRDVLE